MNSFRRDEGRSDLTSIHEITDTSSTADMLHRHSYDWYVFGRYLELLTGHVKVHLKDVENSCDVQAVYLNTDGTFSYKFGLFLPDEDGFDTTSIEIHDGIHDAFRSADMSSRYIGFRGCGRIPIAPSTQVGLMYSKYGYGIFKDGDHLPVPCAVIETEYGNAIHKFRTDAPAGVTRKPHQ